MQPFEIRIKRFRTQKGETTFEILEKWAKMEGRTLPNAIEHLLNNSPIFKEYSINVKFGDRLP